MSDAFERAVDRAHSTHRRRRRNHAARLQRRGFRVHATVFAAVQLGLLAIWLIATLIEGEAEAWFLYGLAGWGVALAIHYWLVRRSFSRSLVG